MTWGKRRALVILLVLAAFFAMSSLAQATVRIDIDLSTQTMHVASGTGEAYDWPISSGRRTLRMGVPLLRSTVP